MLPFTYKAQHRKLILSDKLYPTWLAVAGHFGSQAYGRPGMARIVIMSFV